MKCALALALIAPAVAFVAPSGQRSATAVQETKADLETLAQQLNPIVGYYDPLSLAEADFWGKGNEATIGWLRHAEIKHGRVAMAAFVGFCLSANSIQFPIHIPGQYLSKSPGETWDAMPAAGKWQIVLFVGLLEFFSEQGGTHYTKGGKPGYFPSFKELEGTPKGLPHPVPLDLFDPFGFSKGASAEKKERGLLCEINNGRLAQLGLFGFISESKIPGSVPLLSFIQHYDGDYMSPFEAGY